jgi:aspartyl-tRNA(Asn)/glutamyl-tRNA(Gln) amidotransferase subunit C
MTVRIEDVEHVAKLARLSLDDQEKVEFTTSLNAILNYVEQLQQLNTDDVLPTSHPITIHNVMRPDVVQASLSIEKVLSNAPDHEDRQFKVPSVLE